MHNFTPPCLDTTLRLNELGLTATGQHHTGRHLTVLCLITDDNSECRDCAQQRGRVRSTRNRRLVHPPIGLTAVTLAIRIRTFQCPNCRQRWSQSPAKACVGRSKQTGRRSNGSPACSSTAEPSPADVESQEESFIDLCVGDGETVTGIGC